MNQYFESLPGRRVKNVHIGDVIKIKEYDPELKRAKMKIPWKVEAIYPYFVYAVWKHRHRCINYGELVQLGLE